MNPDTDVVYGGDDRRVPATRREQPVKTRIVFEKRERIPPPVEPEPLVRPHVGVVLQVPSVRDSRESVAVEAPKKGRRVTFEPMEFYTRPPRGRKRIDERKRLRRANP